MRLLFVLLTSLFLGGPVAAQDSTAFVFNGIKLGTPPNPAWDLDVCTHTSTSELWCHVPGQYKTPMDTAVTVHLTLSHVFKGNRLIALYGTFFMKDYTDVMVSLVYLYGSGKVVWAGPIMDGVDTMIEWPFSDGTLRLYKRADYIRGANMGHFEIRLTGY